MLRGEFVDPSISMIVIKEIILQSISSLHFVENYRSLTAGSSTPLPLPIYVKTLEIDDIG